MNMETFQIYQLPPDFHNLWGDFQLYIIFMYQRLILDKICTYLFAKCNGTAPF